MKILDQIENIFKETMKTKDIAKLDILRMLKSELKKKEIDLRRELNDKEVIQSLRSQIKSRKESIKQYKEAKREDLAEKEELEVKVIQSFLPKELSDDELEKLVDEALKESNAKNPSDISKVMPLVIKKAKGLADGGRIKEIVLKKLK